MLVCVLCVCVCVFCVCVRVCVLRALCAYGIKSLVLFLFQILHSQQCVGMKFFESDEHFYFIFKFIRAQVVPKLEENTLKMWYVKVFLGG